jgi:hypothetical protein
MIDGRPIHIRNSRVLCRSFPLLEVNAICIAVLLTSSPPGAQDKQFASAADRDPHQQPGRSATSTPRFAWNAFVIGTSARDSFNTNDRAGSSAQHVDQGQSALQPWSLGTSTENRPLQCESLRFASVPHMYDGGTTGAVRSRLFFDSRIWENPPFAVPGVGLHGRGSRPSRGWFLFASHMSAVADLRRRKPPRAFPSAPIPTSLFPHGRPTIAPTGSHPHSPNGIAAPVIPASEGRRGHHRLKQSDWFCLRIKRRLRAERRDQHPASAEIAHLSNSRRRIASRAETSPSPAARRWRTLQHLSDFPSTSMRLRFAPRDPILHRARGHFAK